MARGRLALLLAGLFIGSTAATSAAIAAPIHIAMTGGILFEGDAAPTSWSARVTVDDGQPDEDPTLGTYLATNHGSLSMHLDGLGGIDFTSAVDQILAVTDFPDSTWELSADVEIASLIVPFTIQLIGTAPIPDQIVPYFFTFTSGTIAADGASLGIGLGTGSVSTLVITPEPGTAWLLAIGLAGLGLRSRH